MLKYIIFITLLFLFTWASGQLSRPVLTTFTSADGLSNNDANNVQSEPDGFIWIATNYGLNRFDGNHFTRFYSPYGKQIRGLTGNRVKQVLCDSLLVWTAIDHGGLNCYFDEIDYFRTYEHDVADSSSLVSNAVNCLFLAADRKIYIGTDSGLSIFNREDSRFTNIVEHPRLKKDLNITSFDQSTDGIIWIGTRQQGVLYYDKRTGLHPINDLPASIQSAIINDLMFDEEKNQLWLATTNGLWCANRNVTGNLSGWHSPFASLKLSSIECIKKDRNGNIWAGTSNSGVFWYDLKNIEHHFVKDDLQDHSLLSNYIKDIFCHADGSIWFSTPKGLQVYHQSRQSFPAFKPVIRYHHENITANAAGLCVWEKYLVAATDKGVWISDTNFIKSYSLSVTANDKQPVRFRNASIVGKNILITGSDGVYQLVFKNDKPALVRPYMLKRFGDIIDSSCNEILMTGDSVVWLSVTSNRIYSLNLRSGKTAALLLNTHDVNINPSPGISGKLYEDRDGRILVGNNGSVSVFTTDGILSQTISFNRNPDYFSQSNYVNDIFDDGKFIWVATNGKGLFKCNRNLDVLNEYNTDDDLCDNTIYCIQPDETGNLWLTTKRGLSVYDTTIKRFTNYYQQHGLPSQEFNPYGKTSVDKRTLYFSSIEGIIQVRPYTFSTTGTSSFHTMISKIMIGNEIMGRGELVLLNDRLGMAVDYGKNIAISFAVVGFLNNYDYSLQYKFSNSDQWLDFMQGSEIILSRLSPGMHKIHVRGVVKTGNSIGKTLTLTLQINPAYYQRWWFISLVIMIVAGFIYGLYKYRVYQVKKVVTLRTKISQDLHDNVGAALSSISIFSHAAILKNESGHLDDSRSILERIGETSREVMGELNDTVWFINPGNDNLQKVIQRITNFALPLCRSKDIFFEVKSNTQLENIDLSVDKRKAIFLAMKESINNSVKHAEAKSLVITIEKNQKVLYISIKDDGIGIPESHSSSGNGLSNLKQRALDIKGKIEINTVHQEGTEIILQLPLTTIGD